jgi:hypothetical protein
MDTPAPTSSSGSSGPILPGPLSSLSPETAKLLGAAIIGAAVGFTLGLRIAGHMAAAQLKAADTVGDELVRQAAAQPCHDCGGQGVAGVAAEAARMAAQRAIAETRAIPADGPDGPAEDAAPPTVPRTAIEADAFPDPSVEAGLAL